MSDHTLHCLDVFIRQTLSSTRLTELYANALNGICETLQCEHGTMLHGFYNQNSLENCASFPSEHQYDTPDCQEILDCFSPRSGLPAPGMVSIKTLNNLTPELLPKSFNKSGSGNAYSVVIRPSINEYLLMVVCSDQHNLTNEVNTEFLTIAAKVLLAVLNNKAHTDTKETEFRSAMQAKHEWVATVDALDDIICTVDLNFNVLRANKAVESWGVSAVDSVSGMDIHKLLHPNCEIVSCELTTQINNISKSLLKNNDDCTQFFDPQLNKDLRISAKKIIIPGSTIDSQIIDNSFAVVIIKDVTEQVAATNLMHKYNERLASDVQERTTQLTEANEQLNDLTRQILNAQEIERRRISLELHDGIGQSLTAIKYFVEELIGSCQEPEQEDHVKKLKHIVERVKDTVDEIRNISMDLRPSILDDLGIEATISWFFREFSNIHSNINIEMDININEKKISNNLATTIYRITQEATNNILKHANATQITYRLVIKNKSLLLSIIDNGTGLNLASNHAHNSNHGMGLIGMKERAMLAGGQINYEPAQSGGLVVRGEWKVN